jgi:hypothetical protein
MITEKAKKLRKCFDNVKKDKYLAHQQYLSTEIFNELIDNCKPTQKEFISITDRLILSSGSLFRLIMEAKDKWIQ